MQETRGPDEIRAIFFICDKIHARETQDLSAAEAAEKSGIFPEASGVLRLHAARLSALRAEILRDFDLTPSDHP